MNVRVKTAILIVVTLVIGIFIGAIGHGTFLRAYRRGKMPPIKPEMIVNWTERRLELTEEQKPIVRPILEAHAKSFFEMNSRHRDEMKASMDSLIASLSDILTEEQLEKLNRPPFGGHMGPRGPHPVPPGDSN